MTIRGALAGALAGAALALIAGCTPVRSTLAPPYPVDGRSLSAEELDAFAIERCERDSQGAPLPPNKFTTDGCSAWRDSRWQTCCIEHDVAYWCGAKRRREADEAFRRCVREQSSGPNATLMYTGVRLGGGRLVPFPWRFGYGFPWPHRQSPHKRPQTALTSP